MKKNQTLPVSILALVSLTALNVVSFHYSEIIANYFNEKTFNLVVNVISGLIAIILFCYQSAAIHRQYTEAHLLPGTHYTLVKLIKHINSESGLEIEGAFLVFWDDSERLCFYFKGVKFSEDADFSKEDRFVATDYNGAIILEPLRP
jgi:hypothetical protein